MCVCVCFVFRVLVWFVCEFLCDVVCIVCFFFVVACFPTQACHRAMCWCLCLFCECWRLCVCLVKSVGVVFVCNLLYDVVWFVVLCVVCDCLCALVCLMCCSAWFIV